jgi:hypothetical protein
VPVQRLWTTHRGSTGMVKGRSHESSNRTKKERQTSPPLRSMEDLDPRPIFSA